MSSKFPPFNRQPTALVVEDERALCEELKEALQSLWPELDIVGEAHDGAEALRLIIKHQPDIVFLDIQIPGASGLEVARHIDNQCHVVFVTAYDAHAIEAFEKGAIDYVLKPVSRERLLVTVERLQQRLQHPPASFPEILQQDRVTQASSGYLRWITASVGNSLRLITIDEVVFFQTDQKYTRVVLAESEVLIKKTLKELLTELDPEQFWQTHRSTLVNVQEIISLDPNIRGQMTIKLKSRRENLPVSENFIRKFRQL
jgi:DNA-binding LytR/AlgR family response regulator